MNFTKILMSTLLCQWKAWLFWVQKGFQWMMSNSFFFHWRCHVYSKCSSENIVVVDYHGNECNIHQQPQHINHSGAEDSWQPSAQLWIQKCICFWHLFHAPSFSVLFPCCFCLKLWWSQVFSCLCCSVSCPLSPTILYKWLYGIASDHSYGV